MKYFIKSFLAAFRGFKEVLIYEKNFGIMLAVAVFVITAMFYFSITRFEKVLLLIVIFSVLSLELINSVVERMLDFYHPLPHEKVRIIKDMMASIVLLASMGATIVGLLIFLPYLK